MFVVALLVYPNFELRIYLRFYNIILLYFFSVTLKALVVIHSKLLREEDKPSNLVVKAVRIISMPRFQAIFWIQESVCFEPCDLDWGVEQFSWDNV